MSNAQSGYGTLWVMRHGKPDLPPNPPLMTRDAFNAYLEDYDRAALSSAESERIQGVRARLPHFDLVLCSDLPRAIKTAEAVSSPLPIQPDPLFREIPVLVPDNASWFIKRRWPSELWWHYVRWVWYQDQGPEGRTRSIERIDAAIDHLLETYDARHRDILLVSHAGFLLVLGQRLRQRGLADGPRFPNILFGHPTRYHWRAPSDLQS